MRFVNPAFLFALFSISIPILIHLFNFRKFKTVYFTNVRFLREVKEETQSKSQLKHLLVLLARILAITFLVLAFAQPYIPYQHKLINTGAKAISVFIDNSFSMGAENKSGLLLDEAKKDARQIAAAYKPGDQFQLLTNDFEGRHQRLLNREEFLEMVDEVKLSPSVRTLSEIFTRQADVLNSSGAVKGGKTAFIISDFQKSISDADKIKNDTSIQARLIPVIPEERKNLYVDSCWFESPQHRLNEAEALHVRIRNASSQEYADVPMKLFINGQQKSPSSFSIAANGKVDTTIAFTIREPGLQQGRVEITDSPITFDDKFYFSFRVDKTIPVLCVQGGGTNTSIPAQAPKGNPIGNLFKRDSAFSYTEVPESGIDYSALTKNRLIILNELSTISSGLSQELDRFVKSGGSLLIFPALHADITGYHDFLQSIQAGTFTAQDTAKTKVDQLNMEQEIYRQGVFEHKNGKDGNVNVQMDLPQVFNHYKLTRNTHSSEEYLMRLRGGDVYLARYSLEKGKVYLCTSSLDPAASNFSRHALFVPTLLQIAFFSQAQGPMFYTIGNDEVISLNSNPAGGESVFHIRSGDSTFDIIPEHRVVEARTDIYVRNQVKEAGNYMLMANKEPLMGLSFNFNRKESDVNIYTPADLKSLTEKAGFGNFNLVETGQKDLRTLLSEIDQGKKLWKLCIILALLFLAAEIALLRLMK